MEVLLFIIFLLLLIFLRGGQQGRGAGRHQSPFPPAPGPAWPESGSPLPPGWPSFPPLVEEEPVEEPAAVPIREEPEKSPVTWEGPQRPAQPPSRPHPRGPAALGMEAGDLWRAVVWAEILGSPVCRRKPGSNYGRRDRM